VFRQTCYLRGIKVASVIPQDSSEIIEKLVKRHLQKTLLSHFLLNSSLNNGAGANCQTSRHESSRLAFTPRFALTSPLSTPCDKMTACSLLVSWLVLWEKYDKLNQHLLNEKYQKFQENKSWFIASETLS